MDHLIQFWEIILAMFLCYILLSCFIGFEAAAEKKKWSLNDGKQDCSSRCFDTIKGVWRAVGFAFR